MLTMWLTLLASMANAQAVPHTELGNEDPRSPLYEVYAGVGAFTDTSGGVAVTGRGLARIPKTVVLLGARGTVLAGGGTYTYDRALLVGVTSIDTDLARLSFHSGIGSRGGHDWVPFEALEGPGILVPLEASLGVDLGPTRWTLLGGADLAWSSLDDQTTELQPYAQLGFSPSGRAAGIVGGPMLAVSYHPDRQLGTVMATLGVGF